MDARQTHIAIPPYFNHYSNYACDIWSSTSYFQNGGKILSDNQFFQPGVNGLFVYAVRNCIIVFQMHGTTLRYNRSIEVSINKQDKINVVSFARCLEKPILFVGSVFGNCFVYYLDTDKSITPRIFDARETSIEQSIKSADWADGVNVYYPRSTLVFQWNIETMKISAGMLTSPDKNVISESKSKIVDYIKLSRVDPLLMAASFAPAFISIIQLKGFSMEGHTVLMNFDLGPSAIASMAFPFLNGIYKNGIFAAACRNGTIRVWELDSGTTLEDHHLATRSEKKGKKIDRDENYFAISFIPRLPFLTENSDETKNEVIEPLETTDGLESDVLVLDDSEKKFTKLLISRADGKIAVINVTIDGNRICGWSARPELIGGHRLAHHAPVFTISVINPYNYEVVDDKRIIHPCWDLKNLAASISMDHHVLLYDLEKMTSIRPKLPTVNLQVHDLDFSPDNTRLLIGHGDGAKIWNFNYNAGDLLLNGPANYRFESIPNVIPSRLKILSVAWYPHDEKNQYTIGIGSVSGNFVCIELSKSQVLYTDKWPPTELESRIYSCKWGPIPSEFEVTRRMACYTVYCNGDVRVHVISDQKAFNIDELSKGSLHRNLIRKTECVWKDDYNYIAVGYDDGKIYICLNEGHFIPVIIIDAHWTFVSCIRWHPDSITKYNDKTRSRIESKNISKYESWIASGSKNNEVYVFDLKEHLIFRSSNEQSPTNIYKPTHSFRGHEQGIVSLDWNKVEEGMLASCSLDKTVHVWNLNSLSRYAVFVGHWSKVFTVVWAPWDANLIFSSGDDNSIQVWSAKEIAAYEKNFEMAKIDATVDIDSSKLSIESVSIVDEEKVSLIHSSGSAELSTVNSLSDSVIEITNSTETNMNPKVSLESLGLSKISIDEKKISSKVPSRQISQSSGNSLKHLESSMKKHRNSDKSNGELSSFKEKKKSLLPKLNFMENCSTKMETLNDIEFLLSKRYNISYSSTDEVDLRTRNLIFLDKNEINELCQSEISNHKQSKNLSHAFHISALQGNLKEMITEAAKTNQLSDWMVSQAASVSREFWHKIVLAYAVQLEKSNDPLQAALYYSSIHRTMDAVRTLINAGQYKEALILVKSREPHNSELINNIQHSWAEAKEKDTNYEFAAKIYVANMETAKASECLSKRPDDPKCQQLKHLIETKQPQSSG